MSKYNTYLYRLRTIIAGSYRKYMLYVLAIESAIRRHVTLRRLLYAGIGTLLALIAIYSVTFLWPRTVQFSYSDKNCFVSPTLLPRLADTKTSQSFTIEQQEGLSVGGYAVYSHRSCIKALQAPRSNATEEVSLTLPGSPLAQKRIMIKSGPLPGVRYVAPTQTAISTKDPLSFSLSTADRLFNYSLEANDRKTRCNQARDHRLSCDTRALGLAQGTTYQFTLHRIFRAKSVDAPFQQALSTVEPVRIVSSSISSDELVFNAPSEIVINVDKPIRTVEGVRLENVIGESRQSLPATATFQDTLVIIRFTEPLPRSAHLLLTVGAITASDGGYLNAPFSLPFQTSGGPKVKSISIGSYRVQPGATMVITFDSALASGQNLGSYIRVESGGNVSINITAQGNRVVISPASLGRCVPFTVIVSDGFKNEFGISGGSSWQFRSRTICQTVFSIGSSVQGRSITAYRFGNGPSKIIFVGGTHGDERSSVQILNKWVDQLENNPDRIPAHQTIIVIPTINPDGYAANRRTNANNVDLNRNFPANNWKPGVTMPDKSYLEHGGGTEPLSEPESRALANYVLSQSPRLVLTYHAAGSVVVPNGSGDSNAIAIEYGKKSTVGYMSNSQTGTFFEYDTTGAFEDWLHDKHSIPTLLIELSSRTSNDYSGHQTALWYIAGL